MGGKTAFAAALIGYSLIMIVVGILTRLKNQKNERHPNLEFWMAKRQMPGWMLAVSLTSGWLMLGWIGFGMSQIYMYGATALWILNIPWFILCIIVIFIVPLVRRIPAVSVPEAIEKRFGKPARLLVAVFSIFVFIAWTQAELFMGGKLIAPFMGLPQWACMAALIAPVLIYMFLSGFRVIIITDQIQFALMAVFMIVLAGAAVMGASQASSGNIIEALRQAAPPTSGPGSMFNLWFLGWLFPIVLLVGYLPGWLLEQDLALRIQAAPNTREARKGAIWGFFLISTFVLALPTVVAACALVVFPPVNGAAPDTIGSDALGIVSAFIAKMPFALAVFMFLGIVACQMSTVDTFANVAALALGYDIIDPILRKKSAQGEARLRASKWTTFFILLVSLGCALINDSLQDVYYISSGVLSASVAVPAIFIYWKRTTSTAVCLASVAGFVGTVGGYFYEYKFLQSTDANAAHYYMNSLPVWLQQSYMYNYVAAGVLLSVVVLVGVSLLTPRPAAERLAEVRPEPVDDYEEFALATEAVVPMRAFPVER